MATWPAKFPLPQRRNYSAIAQMPFIKSTFPSGQKRRRIDNTTEQVYDVECVFPEADFPYFWSWLRHKTGEGVDVISDFSFRDGDGTVTELPCYIDAPTVRHVLVGNHYKVRFTVRTDQISTPTESEFDAWELV